MAGAGHPMGLAPSQFPSAALSATLSRLCSAAHKGAICPTPATIAPISTATATPAIGAATTPATTAEPTAEPTAAATAAATLDGNWLAVAIATIAANATNASAISTNCIPGSSIPFVVPASIQYQTRATRLGEAARQAAEKVAIDEREVIYPTATVSAASAAPAAPAAAPTPPATTTAHTLHVFTAKCTNIGANSAPSFRCCSAAAPSEGK